MNSENLKHKRHVFIVVRALYENLNGILEIFVSMIDKKDNEKRVRNTASPIAKSRPDAPILFFFF